MITAIWSEMTAKLQASNFTLIPTGEHKHMAPKDPLDPDYFKLDEEDKTPAPPTPQPEQTIPTKPLETPTDLPDVTDFSIDKGGPLTILINNHTTGEDRKRRIHFYTLGRRPIGCSTKYNPAKQTPLNNIDDYVENYKDSEVCKFCGRHAAIPQHWLELARISTDDGFGPGTDDKEAEDSDDNESCSTNDTASDEEPSLL